MGTPKSDGEANSNQNHLRRNDIIAIVATGVGVVVVGAAVVSLITVCWCCRQPGVMHSTRKIRRSIRRSIYLTAYRKKRQSGGVPMTAVQPATYNKFETSATPSPDASMSFVGYNNHMMLAQEGRSTGRAEMHFE